MDDREGLMMRLGFLRDAITTVDIESREGYFKQPGVTEDVPARINLYYNKYMDWLTSGKQPFEDFQKPKPTQQSPLVPEKKYSDEKCLDCGRLLTLKEMNYITKNQRDKICYQCDQKRKE